MEKLRLVALSVLLSFALTSVAYSFENEPDGFRGIKWGTNIKDLHDMTFSETNKSTHDDIYERKGDSLKIGDAKLALIGYLFYEGKFWGVSIMFEVDNFSSLKYTLIQKYGAGRKVNFSNDMEWDGENVKIDIREASNKYGHIFYQYVPILKHKLAVEKAKAKKAGSDL